MEVADPKYIGSPITAKLLRDWIVDEKLSETDSVLLHPDDFDNIVLEYRELYGQPMPNHYLILGVLVDESTRIPVPKDRIVVVKDDNRPNRLSDIPISLPLFDDERIIYRCMYCGNVVNGGGGLLDAEERQMLIGWLQARRSNTRIQGVTGACCVGGKTR